MKPKESALRDSYARLRAVCKSFEERLVLGEAVRRGWPALAIEREARKYSGRTSKDIKLRHAIQETSQRRYISPDEIAADQAWLAAKEAVEATRKSIRATKANRPTIPSQAWSPIRAACLTALDCDHLQTILDDGWDPDDVLYLSRQLSIVVGHRRPNVHTPAAIRLALELIQGRAAGQYSPYLPRPSQTTPQQPKD